MTDIKDVAIRNGHNSSKLNAAHANGNISIGNIADVYGVVKNDDVQVVRTLKKQFWG